MQKRVKYFFYRYTHVNWALFDQALVSGANFLTGVLLVRYLGVDQYGLFVLLWMIVQFSMSLQNAMVVSPMLSIAPKVESDQQAEYLSTTLSMQIGFCIILSLFALLAQLFPVVWMPQWWSQELVLPLTVCAITFQLQDYLRRNMFARLRAAHAFGIDLVAYGGQVLLLVIFLSGIATISNALWLISTALGISTVLGFLLLGSGPRVSIAVIKATTFRHWISSRWLVGAAVLQWLSGNYFLIAAGSLLGPAAVGGIRAAQNLLGVTHIMFQGLENVVPGEASRKFRESGASGLRRYLRKVLLLLLILTAAAALFMAIFTEPLFTAVYGQLDPNSQKAMFWYVPIYILVAACLPYRAGLRTIEKTRSVFISYVFGTVFSMLAANYLVTEFAVHGVMFGMLIIQVIMVAVLALSFKRGLETQ